MLKGGYRGFSPLNNSSPPLYIYINIYILVPPPSRSLDPLLFFEIREKRKEAKEKREKEKDRTMKKYTAYISLILRGTGGHPPFVPLALTCFTPTRPRVGFTLWLLDIYRFSQCLS